MVHRTVLLALLAALLLSGCGLFGDGPDEAADTAAGTVDGDDDSTGATPEATTALGALEAAAADGTDPVTLAVTEFSLLFGEVPGALPIVADDSLPRSGTGAVSSIVGVWDRLDDQQRDAVRAHLAPWRAASQTATPIGLDDALAHGGDSGADTVPTAGIGPPGDATVVLAGDTAVLARTPDDDILAEVRAAAVHVFSSLGGERPTDVLVQQSSTPLAEGDAITRAGVLTRLPGIFALVFGDDGPDTGRDCRMVLGPSVPTMSEPVLRALVAHEFFHCWSIVNSPDMARHVATPGWYQEGLASWVGEDYAGGSVYASNWWRLWLTPTVRPVTTTTYPAIGFWAWVDQATGGGLLGQVRELHRIAITGDSLALYGAAVQALDDELVTGLAASRSRQPGWGPRWDLATPGITADAVDAARRTLALGATEVGASPVSLVTESYRRPDAGDTVLGVAVAADGWVRARWSDGTEVVAADRSEQQRWCLTDPCVCPDGTTIAGWDVLGSAADVLTVAVTGGAATPSTATLTVEELCEDDAPPPATTGGDGPLLGTWRSQPSAMVLEAQSLFPPDSLSTASYAGGHVDLTFAADGTMEAQFVDVVLLLQSVPDQPSVPLEVTGGGTLSYSIDNTTMRFTGQEWEVVFRIAGVDGALPIGNDDVPSGAPTEAVWGIDQGTLTLQTRDGNLFLPNQYRKP